MEKMSKEEFEKNTAIKTYSEGDATFMQLSTKTKRCNYSQVYRVGVGNAMERYLNFYYPLYVNSEED